MTPGSKLGPYQLVSPIGRGGMGEVWKALDTRLGREVAVKLSAERFSDRFDREARAIAALNHPNICTLFDVGPNYLVMELIDGPTLADRIDEGPIPLEESLAIAKQIADALEAAHEKNIIHRDLKPANIKLQPNGAVKVLDFGLAKAEITQEYTADAPTVTLLHLPTEAGVILGTPAYMSPEQARGKSVDKRADIWSFGVVLGEMVTGKRLFQGEDLTDTLASVVKSDPDLTTVPPKLRRLLARCLQKDAKKRLRDIGDWAELLDEPVGQTPSSARGIRSRLWPATAAAFALIAAAGIFAWWRDTRPVERPLMRFNETAAYKTQDILARAAIGPLVAMSPDGGRLAWTPNPVEGIRLRRLEDSHDTLLAGTENAAAPFFSPDGRWIGFFVGQVLTKISAEGGSAVKVCDVGGNPRGGGFWSDDGFIYFAAQQTPVMRVPENGGKPSAVTLLDTQNREVSNRGAQVLPGGEAFLFEASTDNNTWEEATIVAQSFKTQQRKILVTGGYFGRYIHGADPDTGHLLYRHADTLFAAPMDARRLELTGPAVPVLEDVTGRLNNGSANFAFSASGDAVYISGQSGVKQSLFFLTPDGNSQLMAAEPRRYASVAPGVSPDGTRIAAEVIDITGNGFVVYDWAQNRMTALASLHAEGSQAVWTPDGKHLAYFGRPNNTPGIYWVRADRAGDPVLLLAGNSHPRSFSPDGSYLAYDRSAGGSDNGIWIAQLDLTNPDRPHVANRESFLKVDTAVISESFSPDGRWLAYASAESGRFEVYVKPFPGPGAKWQISTNGGGEPFWFSDGRTLSWSNPTGRFVTNYSAKGDTFTVDPPHPWRTDRSPAPIALASLMPDGKRAVAIMPTPDAGQKDPDVYLTFLLNFADELKRKAPTGKK